MLLHRLCAEKLKEGKVKGEPTRRVEKKKKEYNIFKRVKEEKKLLFSAVSN